jgi:hypothetical protein
MSNKKLEACGWGLAIYLILITQTLPRQQCSSWIQTFGGNYDDEGRSVNQTVDGGYIIVGHFSPSGLRGEDIWLIKSDAKGNKKWERTFGGMGKDFGYSVQQTVDGGYIITGTTFSYGAGYYDVWLIKTDSKGYKEWDRTFGGSWGSEDGYSVQQTTDGGYIVVGNTTSYSAGCSDVYLIKTDFKGNKEWEKTFGGRDYDYGYSVQQTTDGGYIIPGCGLVNTVPV